jgi:predicted membrane chloride channel (bestrophin family)
MRVLPIIVLHLIWSTFVVIMHSATSFRLRAPSLLHTLLGGVLGLLLAFRTNQAYERFWSSCKLWSALHSHLHNFARIAAQLSNRLNANLYPAILRHLIAFPIALKQHLRRERDEKEFWPILWLSEIDAIMSARAPHMVLLAELSLLITPMRLRDDGTGKDLAVWNALEHTISQLQSVAIEMERVVMLPPPTSYSLLTARFVFLYVGTLPFVLIGLTRLVLVPPMMLLVAWALYSTEELAQLLEAPFGNALQPETVPMDMYCAHIVTELQQQAFIQRALMRRVADGSWIFKPEDLVAQPPATGADDPVGGGGAVTDV